MSNYHSFVCSNRDIIVIGNNQIRFEKFKNSWDGGSYLPVEIIELSPDIADALRKVFEQSSRYRMVKEALQ